MTIRYKGGWLRPLTLSMWCCALGCAGLETDLPHSTEPEIPTPGVSVEIVDVFRQVETERADELQREIERLQADLRRAEEALIQAESGLAGTHTRAEAVSSLAVARIQIERAAGRAPWRRASIEDARAKLAEAEGQVAAGRFGAALFFVYRAVRIAEALSDEADLVGDSREVHIVRASRVNLRGGPSPETPVLAVLDAGTPVFVRSQQGEWRLVLVTGGPSGWIHQSLTTRLPMPSEAKPSKATSSQAAPAAVGP